MLQGSDKIKHYKFCYIVTSLAPVFVRKLWGKLVLLTMNIVKENIWDRDLKMGTYEQADKDANALGVSDAILCLPMRVK